MPNYVFFQKTFVVMLNNPYQIGKIFISQNVRDVPCVDNVRGSLLLIERCIVSILRKLNRNWMLKGAALCAIAMLSTGTAAAEEKRLGDYIYVPAMQVTPEAIISARPSAVADQKNRPSSLSSAGKILSSNHLWRGRSSPYPLKSVIAL